MWDLKVMEYTLDKIGNIVGNGENTGYNQMFSKVTSFYRFDYTWKCLVKNYYLLIIEYSSNFVLLLRNIIIIYSNYDLFLRNLFHTGFNSDSATSLRQITLVKRQVGMEFGTQNYLNLTVTHVKKNGKRRQFLNQGELTLQNYVMQDFSMLPMLVQSFKRIAAKLYEEFVITCIFYRRTHKRTDRLIPVYLLKKHSF